MTVSQLLSELDAIAPTRFAWSQDRIGIIVGSANAPCTKVLCTLDVTPATVEFAKQNGCDVIIAHHPTIWDPVQTVNADQFTGKVIQELCAAGITQVACHTNWDAATGGVNDTLASLVGLTDIHPLGKGELVDDEYGLPFGRVGSLETAMSGSAFRTQVDAALGGASHWWGPLSRSVKKVAVVAGAGGGLFEEVAKSGADALVTGEFPHHLGVILASQGMLVLAAGHYHSEHPGMVALAARLADFCPTLVFERDTVTPV